MKLKYVVFFIMSCYMSGCNSDLGNKQIKAESSGEMLGYLMDGYLTDYPNLFCDEPIYSKECRLRKLIDEMGYQDFYYAWPDRGGGEELWYIKQTSDREQPYSEVLVLSTTNPPQVKRMYHDIVYNDFGQGIGTKYRDQNKKEHVKFNNGNDVLVDGPYLFDTTGTYYCKGGRRYCCQENTFVDDSVLVYSVDSLESPIYRSKLVEFPEKMIFANGEICLIAKSDSDPSGLEVEVVRKQESDNWVITEHYVVEPPRFLYAVRFLHLMSFDPATKNMIVYAKQDWPLGGKLYFYDYQQKTLLRKSFLDYPVLEFFNPLILANNVKYIKGQETTKAPCEEL